MRFQEYLLTEGRSRGEDMEDAIISVWNGDPFPEGLAVPKEPAEKIVEYLKQLGLQGEGEVIGASNIDVSDEWKQYFPGGKVPAMTKTPKTDFIIGNDKISLKSGDSAQLMSGGRSETVATFYTALDKAKSAKSEILEKLEESIVDLASSHVTGGKIAKQLKAGEDEILNKADKAHKEIQKLLKSYFEKDQTFRREFAYEAMTGEVKFGGNIGTCTHFLVVSWDGENVHYKDCQDTSYIDEVAQSMKPSVRFKTTSVKRKGKKTGEYRYWSVVGLIVDKLNEEMSQYTQDDLLNEGVFRNIVDKIKKWFKNVFKKIKDYLKKSAANIIEFLELEPEIDFNNEVPV